MLKKYGVACLLLIASFLPFGSASAVIIGFSPSSSIVNVGDTFNVDVVISDLFASGEIVSAFDLDVTYNAAVLDATGVTFGSYLDDLFFPSLTDSVLTSGRIDFSELSFLFDVELLAIQPDSFTLATLSFDAIAEGNSLLEFDPDSAPLLGALDVKGFFDLDTFEAEILTFESVGQSNITVQGATIPEPGIAILMLTGLLGIGVANRKRA